MRQYSRSGLNTKTAAQTTTTQQTQFDPERNLFYLALYSSNR